ncbi:hypothetical protein [Mycolicibacterium sphagni]|uniref:hypothetical protein n=1 Tax=Mycolicibacterium sphagni TaxID=1786 RepID=UPI001F1864F7|nr:hypothetical protein [Mycolicibacterium sphagni]
MHQSLPTGIALAAVIALATAGCGGSDQSSSSSKESTSSASAAASAATTESAAPTGANGDYSSLLIKPSDIGPEATADGPPTANPGGTTGTGQTFKTTDGNRIIVVTIAVFPDAAAAAGMIQPMKDAITDKVDGQQKPVDIGSNGFMVEGPAKKKSMEVSEVVFTEGRALVDLEYDSAPGNPAPSDAVLDVARKQAAAVSAGLPG